MKLSEFLKYLNVAYESPNIYKTGGWGKWNGTNFEFDCICLVKSILWNFIGIREGHGGAVYASNGVPDYSTEQMINVCNNVSNDFNSIHEGEMLWMQGHVGIYVGNGNVIEATAGWDTWKVIMSQVDNKGNRTYNGQGGSNRWQKHGYLPYVDYSEEPQPEPSNDIKVGDWVVPIELVNYSGTPLTQYDEKYIVTELYGDRAVCCAERHGEWQVWAAMNVNNLRKVD